MNSKLGCSLSGEETNIVPVVMGGADPSDYKRLAIPGSYINVMDCKTTGRISSISGQKQHSL